MKARLYITIDAKLLKKAKKYASENGVSISKMVENHFIAITGEREKQSLLTILDSMPKTKSSFLDEFDFKKEYYKERRAKYGF